MTHNVVFNSANNPDGEVIALACGHISLNEIEFTNEGIIVSVESRTGEVVFYDLQKNELSRTKIQLPAGDERFSEIKCDVEGEKLLLGFPEYSYKDNYPNCDGEHDRWTKTICGFKTLSFDFKK